MGTCSQRCLGQSPNQEITKQDPVIVEEPEENVPNPNV